ncbi:MAG: hypothetical protein ACP5E4_01270, partial [Candidatus Aenigmatarchaeota archaeon]
MGRRVVGEYLIGMVFIALIIASPVLSDCGGYPDPGTECGDEGYAYGMCEGTILKSMVCSNSLWSNWVVVQDCAERSGWQSTIQTRWVLDGECTLKEQVNET